MRTLSSPVGGQLGNSWIQAHKGRIGDTQGGPQGPTNWSRKWEIPVKQFFQVGFWGNGPAQRPPGYHTIHFPFGGPQSLHWGNNPSMISCFWGPTCWPQRVPGPTRAKCWARGPKFGPGCQKPKRCAPKKRAKPRLQNWKWSHMVQVMAQNHLGEARPVLGPIFRGNVPKVMEGCSKISLPSFSSGSSGSTGSPGSRGNGVSKRAPDPTFHMRRGS